MGAAQSPLLGAAMFGPAILYIGLLIGAPFLLAVFYAFSDARIGSNEIHYVGFENFRSILQSPSFIKAIKNSIVFTVFAQIIVIICSNILAIVLEKKFRGRGLVRFLILLPWVAPVSLGTIGWKWILDSIYSVITWVLVWAHLVKPYDAPMWLGQPYLGHGVRYPGPLLAIDSFLYRHPARWSYGHSKGNSRSRGHRWSWFLAYSFPDQSAHDETDPERGHPVWHHLHLH